MTREEAIHKMEYSKRAYQMLIDEKVQEGVLVGKGINAEWSADTPIIDAYKDMLDACEMAIKALEQEPSEIIHGSTYGGVSWGGKYKPQEPCEDCISREVAIDAIRRIGMCQCSTNEIEAIDECRRAVEALPPAMAEPKTDILDSLKEEITNIEIYGQVDSHTSFIRTGEQVKDMTIEIIDKYREKE